MAPRARGRAEGSGKPSLVLWHGAQRWSGPPQILPAKSMKAVEYGPGFYLTSDVDVARGYAKGGGSLMRFEVDPDLHLLDKARIPYWEMEQFVASVPRLRHRKEIGEDLIRFRSRGDRGPKDPNDLGPAAVLGNLMHYHGAVAGEPGVQLVEFYLRHGIDADLVTGKGQRGDAHYVVLYNLDKIRSYKKVSASELGRAEGRVAGERWFHLTDRARFALDKSFAPTDNAIAIEDRSGRPGIYLSPRPEDWVLGHDYVRPFLVELDVDASVKKDSGVHGRYSGEMFVPATSFDKLRVVRVIPLDAYAREEYGDYGWIEDVVGREFDTGRSIPPLGGRGYPFRGYRYPGPDVRKMSAADVARLKKMLSERKAILSRGARKRKGAAGGKALTYDVLDSITRPGHYYRGLSEAEMNQALERGYIKSDMRWSASDEGTCFGEDACTASSYANMGKTDPRKTGKANFIVEVPSSAAVGFFIDRRDGYPKTLARVPLDVVTRAFRVSAAAELPKGRLGQHDGLFIEEFSIRRA